MRAGRRRRPGPRRAEHRRAPAVEDLRLSEAQTRTLVVYFFFFHGKFPPRVSRENWEAVKMSEMQFDDPPLLNNPHFEKEKLARLLVEQFNNIGLTLKSPLALMKTGDATMEQLWRFCFENQGIREDLP